jgi:hypothetical protein
MLNTSGYRGVYRYRRDKYARWMANITIKGKSIPLGYFSNPEDAARAYDAAARQYYPRGMPLNFPED